MSNNSNIIIVIPTYWTWSSEQADGPVDAAYDHPTPLDGESTLPRLLDSLVMLNRPPFSVLVLTAAVHHDLEQSAAQRVEALVKPYRPYFPITQFAAADLQLLREHVAAVGYDPSLVALRDYASVRNCQLIIPHLMGSEVVVALDDDEVVEPEYLRVATEFVSEERPGIGGFYLDHEGGVLLPEGEPTGNPFLDKSALMNEGTRSVQANPGRLVPTPVVLGGNMVFHRSLWERVSFDPWITRGEDIDYLINARLHGYEFYLDKELTITHIPPEAYGTLPYAKLAQDVVRFLYERGKLLAAHEQPGLVAVETQDLDPYPGRLLQENMAAQALAALQRMATPDTVAHHGSPEQIVEQATQWAREAPLRYFEFAQEWPRLLGALDRDVVLRDHWTRTET
ncbi:MAG: glycosyltransferase family 2 protein [Chloroflexota bacterium]|nr:glycosyltransferase family 2 protein [Chloroflexota bacterium]